MRNANFLFPVNDTSESRKRDAVLFQCCAYIKTHRTWGTLFLSYLETLMRRPILPLLNIQSLCTFRLPTAFTLAFSAVSSPCPPSLLCPLFPPDSLSLLDLPLRACVYSALYLAVCRDSLCFELQLLLQSSCGPWQLHTQRNSRRVADGIGRAHPPQPRLRRIHW